MSQVLIILIRVYQAIFSPLLATALGPTAGCRYEISCSEYAVQALQTQGVLKGSWRSIVRIAHCL